MIQSLRNKRRRSQSSVRTLLLIAISLFIVGSFMFYLRKAIQSDQVVSLKNSLVEDLYVTELGEEYTKEDLIRNNNQLYRKVLEFDIALSKAQLLLDTNTQVSGYINQSFEQDLDGVVVGVISRPPITLHDTFVLDRGSEVGIKDGSYVLSAHGSGLDVLGRIVRTQDGVSRVQSYSTPGDEIGVFHVPTETSFVARGKGGFEYEWLAPRNMELAVGDLIEIAGSIPFILGEIARIDVDDVDPVQTVTIRPRINIRSVRFVYVEL